MQKRRLTVKERNGILSILSVGCSRETAAKYVQCCPVTLRRYIREHPKFAAQVAKAEQESELFFVSKIRKASDKEQYWRAAAWALERRYPNRYGKRKPDAVNKDELQELFRQFGDIVGSEIEDKTAQEQVLKRLEGLLE